MQLFIASYSSTKYSQWHWDHVHIQVLVMKIVANAIFHNKNMYTLYIFINFYVWHFLAILKVAQDS